VRRANNDRAGLWGISYPAFQTVMGLPARQKPSLPQGPPYHGSSTESWFKYRIMVQVQSSWFPVIDRNPHIFTDIYKAKESAMQKIYRELCR
jgi:hypothetical protein